MGIGSHHSPSSCRFPGSKHVAAIQFPYQNYTIHERLTVRLVDNDLDNGCWCRLGSQSCCIPCLSPSMTWSYGSPGVSYVQNLSIRYWGLKQVSEAREGPTLKGQSNENLGKPTRGLRPAAGLPRLFHEASRFKPESYGSLGAYKREPYGSYSSIAPGYPCPSFCSYSLIC